MKNDVSHVDKLLKPIFYEFPEKRDAGSRKSDYSASIFGSVGIIAQNFIQIGQKMP